MKVVASQSVIGQLGANLVERIVLQMRYVWRPLVIFDVGVDGEIEICDPTTGEATNALLRVQVKATTRPFQSETAESFEYTCEQRDLEYWLQGNAPVILIVCRPASDEAYWVSIKNYFGDFTELKSKRVIFDKKTQRFDVNCASSLKSLALPKDSGVYFSPIAQQEILYTNLLQVDTLPKDIYIANTEHRDPGELWAHLKTKDIRIDPEWMLIDKQIVSLHDLREYPFSSICDTGTCEWFSADEWANSEDEVQRRGFVRLLKLCLRERCRQQGLWYFNNKKSEFFFFPAPRNMKTLKVPYQSIKQHTSREVFKQYWKKKDISQAAYCRHLAFKGNFLQLDNVWYLEITPTYHFTSNGRDEDKFKEEHLKGIKRLERNPAVLGQLLMWCDFLQKPIETLLSEEYTFLSFGKLATIELSSSIPDDIWYEAEEGSEVTQMNAHENQLSFIGL